MVKDLRERIKKRDQFNQIRDYLLRVQSLKENSLKMLTILLRELKGLIRMKIEYQDHLIMVIMLDQILKGNQMSRDLRLDFRDKVTRGLVINSKPNPSNLIRGCQEELKLLDLADQ